MPIQTRTGVIPTPKELAAQIIEPFIGYPKRGILDVQVGEVLSRWKEEQIAKGAMWPECVELLAAGAGEWILEWLKNDRY